MLEKMQRATGMHVTGNPFCRHVAFAISTNNDSAVAELLVAAKQAEQFSHRITWQQVVLYYIPDVELETSLTAGRRSRSGAERGVPVKARGQCEQILAQQGKADQSSFPCHVAQHCCDEALLTKTGQARNKENKHRRSRLAASSIAGAWDYQMITGHEAAWSVMHVPHANEFGDEQQ